MHGKADVNGDGDPYRAGDDLTFRWHDNLVYGLSFDIGDPERQDWRSELRLDIDFIAEWVCEADGRCNFRVAPATLVFHDATDLAVSIDQGDTGGQVAIGHWSIDRVLREPLERPMDYWRWTILLNQPAGGRITFGASRFSQSLRAEPILVPEPWLPRGERGA
jgi:hypothetical protein